MEEDFEKDDTDFHELLTSLSEDSNSRSGNGISSSLEEIGEALREIYDIQEQTLDTNRSTQSSVAIGELANNIAIIALDAHEPTGDLNQRAARENVAREILPTVETSLKKLLKEKEDAEKFLPLRQNDFADRIAWRLRHGHALTWSKLGTYLPYWGEVSETNKPASVFGNVISFWQKAHFYHPVPSDAKHTNNRDTLIEESIEEIYNEKIRGFGYSKEKSSENV